MRIGTKSVLFGAHAWWLHPFFVAFGWWKLYGIRGDGPGCPRFWDPRLRVAFFIHDLGYWGKPNMDGEEGEKHPEWGALVMSWLFDRYPRDFGISPHAYVTDPCPEGETITTAKPVGRWGRLVLFHSRFYAKQLYARPSRLCFADKLAICITPWWVYRWTAGLTGEIREYREDAANPSKGWSNKRDCSDRKWYLVMQKYTRKWVEEFKDGREDTWTEIDRTTKGDSGVRQ